MKATKCHWDEVERIKEFMVLSSREFRATCKLFLCSCFNCIFLCIRVLIFIRVLIVNCFSSILHVL